MGTESRLVSSAKLKFIGTLFLIILYTNALLAQMDNDSIKDAKNTFFMELFGNGGLYSVNYDRILVDNNNFFISVRGGCSYIPFNNPVAFCGGIHGIKLKEGLLMPKSLIIPAELNLVFGKKHHFETGCGFIYSSGPYMKSYGTRLFLLLRPVGYRYQRTDGGFSVRLGFIPSIKIFDFRSDVFFNPKEYFYFFMGLGIGYTLKEQTNNM